MTTAAATAEHTPLSASRWALLFGNFAIGCGVMVVAGALNDLTHSLHISAALGGQLIALAAAVMCFGAPLAAVRVVTMLGAAVFTPQAAAAIGSLTPPAERGRAITFIFLGWSVASVLGMPLASYVGDTFGWRYAFALVGVLAAVGAAWVWAAVPDGVKPPALSLAAWREVFTHPVLMAIVLVTALQGAGQFTVFSYFAPYYKQVLGASPAEVSALFFWFGACGFVGNVLLTRFIDRIGAARAVAVMVLLIGSSLALWPLAHSVAAMVLVIMPWGLGCFAANSAQQARLGHAAPALAPALMALNTSAIYLGQAAGAAGGGALLTAHGFAALAPVGVVWMVASLALSVWAGRRAAKAAHAA